MTPAPAPEPMPRDRRFLVDFALSVVLALVVTGPYLSDYGTGVREVAASVLLASSVMLRRLLPGVALAVGTAGAVAQLVASSVPMLGIVVVPVLVYSAARWGRRSHAQAGLVLGLIGSALGPARWALAVGPTSGAAVIYFAMGVTGCASIVLAAYLTGRRRRERLENARQRELSELERSRLLLAEEQQRAASAAVAERNRIARELHDIVAHSLSVIVVQAEGGKALAAKRPEKGPEVLGTIAETSRQALEEMRRMVGLLRSGPGEPEQTSYVPTPGLDDIAELVRRTSDRAQLQVLGVRPPVSQAIGLTGYRIVQESLTNVLKHAGPTATARVLLTFRPGVLEIEVADDGRGAAARNDGRGHGLQGMRERVALHRGTLRTGPRPGGGFVVWASLPLIPVPYQPPTHQPHPSEVVR